MNKAEEKLFESPRKTINWRFHNSKHFTENIRARKEYFTLRKGN